MAGFVARLQVSVSLLYLYLSMQLDENLHMHSVRPNSDVQATIIFFNFAFLCKLCENLAILEMVWKL
jgi:hypothetical protein